MAHRSVSSAVKRALDITAAAVLLLVLSPLAILVAIAVRIAHGSPVLFRHARAGLHERTFDVLKFRTMSGTPRAGETAQTEVSRLTRLGRWLRATSLDEIPQLLNVLRGDMSLVGPRPLPVRYVPRYTREERRRHEVRPGLTGWAQVNGRNALEWEDKLRLDVWYVDNWSVALDARILVRTLRDVLLMRNIASRHGAIMPEFRG